MNKTIQEVINILEENHVRVESVASTTYYALLDCAYSKTGSVRFTILFKLSTHNIVGKVEMYNTDDNTTTLTIKAEHLEEGFNSTTFAKRIYSICKAIKE